MILEEVLSLSRRFHPLLLEDADAFLCEVQPGNAEKTLLDAKCDRRVGPYMFARMCLARAACLGKTRLSLCRPPGEFLGHGLQLFEGLSKREALLTVGWPDRSNLGGFFRRLLGLSGERPLLPQEQHSQRRGSEGMLV